MPFKFSNILNKDRRASTSSTSDTRSLDEPIEEPPPAFRPPVKSISLSGPRLTVTDADQSSPQSVDGEQQRFSDSPTPYSAPHTVNGNGTRSRGNSFDLRVHTEQPGAGIGDILTQPRYQKHQDFDDLDTPIASRSEVDIFPRMSAANPQVQKNGRGIEGLPSRSYTNREELAPAPLTAENLNLAPTLESPLSRQRSTPPKPPPLPLRSIQMDPNIVAASPFATASTYATDSPSGGLAPPSSKPRSGSVSSQRSSRGAGVAALISSSASVASSTSVPVQPHADIFHSVKSKVKDKVRKHKHRKGSEAEGDGTMSNRSSFCSTEDGDDHSVLSGRRRSGTAGSSISKKVVAGGRHIRSNSDASSAAPPMMDGHSVYSDEDDDDEETDSGEETDDDDTRSSFMSRGSLSLPVTGFAVASTKRNQDFHALFPEVDEDDYLIEDYGCALQKDILVQGRIYASENHLCFHANIFGWVTNVVIPFADVISMEKKMTAFVIPNAICVSTKHTKHTFASFISRDSTHDVFKNIWRQSRPSDPGVQRVITTESSAPVEEAANAHITNGSPPAKTTGRHGPTTCKCGDAGEHYQHNAMDATFASSPDKIHSLMFSSGFVKDFMVNDQKLMNLEMSDWKPISADSHLATRSMSYIKPLGGGVGPKQTVCHIVDEADFFDPDKYISMITTTKTPDVPSGGVFSVKTRTCLTWAGANSTRVVVTTQVEFTGKSWIKNLIDKSAVDGQKTYHRDLERAMRAYMKEHATEFARAGGDGETISEEEAAAEQEAAVAEAKVDEAAAARRKREEDERNNLQWAFDRIVGGGKTLFGGIWSLISTIAEILGDFPVTKEMWLALLVLLLLVSNIWTYVSLRNERLSDKSTTRNARRRQQRMGVSSDVGDEQIAQAVVEYFTQAPTGRLPPAEEAIQVMKRLDEVERRVVALRRRVGEDSLDTLE